MKPRIHGSHAAGDLAACRRYLLTWSLILGGLALGVGLAVAPGASAQTQPAQQPQLGVPGVEQGYTTGQILGVQGYYEVTPSGAVVLYPASPVTAPGVMHTILGMFGGTSLVGRRGYFRITPAGELFLYFPPGVPWPGAGTVAPVPMGAQAPGSGRQGSQP